MSSGLSTCALLPEVGVKFLSRVLIKGEKFGRSAWEDKQEQARQELLRDPNSRLFPLDSTTGPVKEAIQEPTGPPKADSISQPPKDIKIVAIDLQPMSPLQGIIDLRADITHPATVPLLLDALGSAKADLVLSDGAPDVTGLHDLDIYVQSQLLFAALNLALCVLRPGEGYHPSLSEPLNVEQLETMVAAKSDSEHPSSSTITRDDGVVEVRTQNDPNRWIAPFLACGDLSAFDADATYHLPKDRTTLDPVQPPTAPPYKRALEMRRLAGGAYGKTS